MTAPVLHIVCGLPGSGKTTRSNEIAASTGAVRLCPDEWMTDLGRDLHDSTFREALERRFWELSRRLLIAGCSVILESGSWLRAERDEWRMFARSIGATVVLHWLDLPFDELLARIRHRETHEGGPHISESDLREWWDLFEPPTSAERDLFDRYEENP